MTKKWNIYPKTRRKGPLNAIHTVSVALMLYILSNWRLIEVKIMKNNSLKPRKRWPWQVNRGVHLIQVRAIQGNYFRDFGSWPLNRVWPLTRGSLITCGYGHPIRAWSFPFWRKSCHCDLVSCSLLQIPQYHHSNISTASVDTTCQIRVIIIVRSVFPKVDSVSKETSVSVILGKWIPLNFHLSQM